LPRRRETTKHGLIDRLDFAAKPGERPAAHHAQHAGVGPLAVRAAGAEFAFDQSPFARQADQDHLRRRDAEAVAAPEVGRRERGVRPRVAQREIAEGVTNGLKQSVWNAGWKRHAKRVPEARRILHRDEPRFAGDLDWNHTAG
jgi:hypothetical protein